MAMEITNNYTNAYESPYVTQKQQNTSKTEAAATRKNTDTATGSNDYFNQLKKLAPSVEFRIGSGHASDKSGQTLTLDPRLLEKMQKDPKFEKDMKDMIKGVESMTRLSESINKATGWKTVFRHSYIDANGKYSHIAVVRNEFGYKMSDKLREERRKSTEKFMKKSKEKAAKKKKELQEKLEEKRTEKKDEKTSKAEKLIKEKIASSQDGVIYMDDTEMREMIEAMKDDSAEDNKADAEKSSVVGTNLDLHV